MRRQRRCIGAADYIRCPGIRPRRGITGSGGFSRKNVVQPIRHRRIHSCPNPAACRAALIHPPPTRIITITEHDGKVSNAEENSFYQNGRKQNLYFCRHRKRNSRPTHWPIAAKKTGGIQQRGVPRGRRTEHRSAKSADYIFICSHFFVRRRRRVPVLLCTLYRIFAVISWLSRHAKIIVCQVTNVTIYI